MMYLAHLITSWRFLGRNWLAIEKNGLLVVARLLPVKGAITEELKPGVRGGWYREEVINKPYIE